MKKILLIFICIFSIGFVSSFGYMISHLFTPVQQDIVATVCIDPGHGGYDSGASNWPLLEKDVTWKITTRVKAILDSTPGITGVLSRGENECPEIYQRGNMAKSIRSRFSS